MTEYEKKYYDFKVDWGWLLYAHRSVGCNPGVTFIYLFGRKLRVDHRFISEPGLIEFSVRRGPHSGYHFIRVPWNGIGVCFE